VAAASFQWRDRRRNRGVVCHNVARADAPAWNDARSCQDGHATVWLSITYQEMKNGKVYLAVLACQSLPKSKLNH